PHNACPTRRSLELPCRGSIGHSDLFPQTPAVITGVGNPAMCKAKILVGDRVIAGAGAEANLLSEAADRFLMDVGQVEYAWFQRRRREDIFNQVVTFPCADFRGSRRRNVGVVDVVNGYGHAVGSAPVSREGVKPDSVIGDEVAPLQNAKFATKLHGWF